MNDEHDRQRHAGDAAGDLSRRDFVAVHLAVGLGAATGAGAVSAAPLPVVTTEVSIKTADGTCDAAFFHPATGTHPGVLVWCDAFGLRPATRELGRRLAAEGYAVLVPNPFYRIGKAPMFDSAANVDFKNPADLAKIKPLMASASAAGAPERDAVSYVAFLDAQPQVDKTKKIGTQGYCMGGPLVVRSAAAVPGRIGAGASFHGGGLVSDKPESPHLLASKIQARMYFGVARNDDERQPDAKVQLKAAFGAAHVPAGIEVYPALHGWCMPDMPLDDGKPIYDRAEAERAWGQLLAFYRATLV